MKNSHSDLRLPRNVLAAWPARLCGVALIGCASPVSAAGLSGDILSLSTAVATWGGVTGPAGYGRGWTPTRKTSTSVKTTTNSTAVKTTTSSTLVKTTTNSKTSTNGSGKGSGKSPPTGSGGSTTPSPYAAWTNGPPQSQSFFPIAVFWQAPSATGSYGHYSSQAAAVAGEKMNIFLGFSGTAGGVTSWPERFGSDDGELEAIKANNLYAIGGVQVPYTQDTSSGSVASMLALANAIGASGNLIGYNAGDEPGCGTAMDSVPAVVAGIQGYDPTRIVLYNQAHWMTAPSYESCLSSAITAMQDTGVASSDLYPVTNPYQSRGGGAAKSDFLSTSNDTLFQQGIMVQAITHYAKLGQPIWAFVESGSDDFGLAMGAKTLNVSVVNGSNTLTNASGWSKFTTSWVGLTVSGAGLPAGTTITAVTSPTLATLSAASTTTASNASVTIGGGVNNSDCVASVNLCVVNGNEYRATPAEVNSEVWSSIINGANGIEYFCHDSNTYSFCLGDAKGGAAAQQAQDNITYIDSTILSFAQMLNSPTVAACSMQTQNYTTSAGWSTVAQCTNNILTMSTTDISVPGQAIVKSWNGALYVIAQSDRRSNIGAHFNIALSGQSGKTATVVYDSNSQYDHANSTLGTSIPLTGSAFSVVLGAHNDHYQVVIYTVK